MATRRQVSIPYLDKAESISTVSFYTTQAALAAENTTPGTGVIAALYAAINAVTLASPTGRIAGVSVSVAASIPTDDAAYNGNKFAIFWTDNVTGDKYQTSIPAIDPSAYNTVTGTKNIILTVASGGTTAIEDLVTAFEAANLSKDGNATTVRVIKKSSARQGG